MAWELGAGGGGGGELRGSAGLSPRQRNGCGRRGFRGLCWESTGGYPPLLPYLVLAPHSLSTHQPSWGLGLILAPLPWPLKPRDRPGLSLSLEPCHPGSHPRLE